MSKKSTVETSPYADEARELLEHGWSPAKVRTYLTQQHGESPDVPSAKALERYRDSGKVQPLHVLPASLVDQAMSTLHRDVDVLRATDDMIAMQTERIVWLRQKEIATDTSQREITSAMRVLNSYLDRRERISRELGLDVWKPKQESEEDNYRTVTEEDFNEMVEIMVKHRVRAQLEEIEQEREREAAQASAAATGSDEQEQPGPEQQADESDAGSETEGGPDPQPEPIEAPQPWVDPNVDYMDRVRARRGDQRSPLKPLEALGQGRPLFQRPTDKPYFLRDR